MNLTLRQAEVLRELRDQRAARGVPPTVREVAAVLGIDSSTVHGHLVALEGKRAAVHVPGVTRTWTPTAEGLAGIWTPARDQLAALLAAWDGADDRTREALWRTRVASWLVATRRGRA